MATLPFAEDKERSTDADLTLTQPPFSASGLTLTRALAVSGLVFISTSFTFRCPRSDHAKTPLLLPFLVNVEPQEGYGSSHNKDCLSYTLNISYPRPARADDTVRISMVIIIRNASHSSLPESAVKPPLSLHNSSYTVMASNSLQY